MFIQSVNIGLPKEVSWKGQLVRTGIFKYPTEEIVEIKADEIVGDGQADLISHGGTNKAVYAYAAEHYAFWDNKLQYEVETGAFGENLTTQGLLDQAVFVGDIFRVGTAVLMAIQPRMPCFKLGVRFNNPAMTKLFFQARKNGIYFKIVEPGFIQKNDAIERIQRSGYNVTIQDITDNYALREKDFDKIKAILDIPFLPIWLRGEFEAILYNL